ncbi:enoyl-CoA hydratase [Rhodococcoides yunnanense]|uniref:enoyl-CoA hydratase n=1 Tax=Rhodococcoides yunnanense TaxID=278209 RepID=UPI00093423D7|nr:enoyl-CoA hydratase [Rhodococcus yunnanensis]
MTTGLHSEIAAGILTLRIDRTERMNALDSRTATELIDALTTAGDDPAVRVVILTGTGRAFSAGADIADMAAAQPNSPDELREGAEQTMRVAAELVRSVFEVPVPVIAQVNGIAAGIGVSIALAADLVYAAEDASFLLAFTSVGLMPDGGSSLLVPAAIGRARANEMTLLAQPMSAADAAASGLITACLPSSELDAHVAAVARRLCRGPRRALELSKRAVTASTLALLDDALQRETEGQIELLTSPDFTEGIEAMLQHRRPRFSSESSQT